MKKIQMTAIAVFCAVFVFTGARSEGFLNDGMRDCGMPAESIHDAVISGQAHGATLQANDHSIPKVSSAHMGTLKDSLAAGSYQNRLAGQVIDQVNAERARYGLSLLRQDEELSRAACVRAEEIVQKFSHTRPDGSKWSTVSAAAYGENIAKGQKTADKVMAAWLTSEGHRKNILKASYGSIGVCAYVYNGVTYWVQLFGK